jgi:hypothetical protein
MKTFKNIFYTKRDYEATNIVCCQSEHKPEKFTNMWRECSDSELKGLTKLYIECDVTYYGYL